MKIAYFIRTVALFVCLTGSLAILLPSYLGAQTLSKPGLEACAENFNDCISGDCQNLVVAFTCILDCFDASGSHFYVQCIDAIQP